MRGGRVGARSGGPRDAPGSALTITKRPKRIELDRGVRKLKVRNIDEK